MATRALESAIEAVRDEIEQIIERYAKRHPAHATPVPGLSVGRIVRPVPPTPHLAEACVCVCIRGARALTIGETIYAQEESRYLVSSVGMPTLVAIAHASPSNPYTALRVDLDLDVARQVMTDIDVRGAETEASEPEPGLAFGTIDRAFLETVARLVRLIEAPKDIPFVSGLVHRELLYRLLSGPGGRRLRQIVRLGSQGNRVAKTAAWLRTHYRDRIDIAQLASMAGMGVSTLHRRFRELTNMSPLQYQKHLRLHEARRRLLDEREDVGSTARIVGYESYTQFIREYRRLFHEPPLRDAKALRARAESQGVI